MTFRLPWCRPMCAGPSRWMPPCHGSVLKGVSRGEMAPALKALLGPDATGLVGKYDFSAKVAIGPK